MAAQADVGETVRLQSSEGDAYEVSLRVAKVSRTLATMLEDLGHQPGDLIPLPNVNSRILRKVLAWAEHHVGETTGYAHVTPPVLPHPPAPSSTTPSTSTPPRSAPPALPHQPRVQPRVLQRTSASQRVQPPPSHILSQWEREFIAKNRDDVYELLLAANYLDIKGLMDILCRAVADMIKGRDPADIRRSFNASGPSNPHPYLLTPSQQAHTLSTDGIDSPSCPGAPAPHHDNQTDV